MPRFETPLFPDLTEAYRGQGEGEVLVFPQWIARPAIEDCDQPFESRPGPLGFTLVGQYSYDGFPRRLEWSRAKT